MTEQQNLVARPSDLSVAPSLEAHTFGAEGDEDVCAWPGCGRPSAEHEQGRDPDGWQPVFRCQNCGQNVLQHRVRPDGSHLSYRRSIGGQGVPCGPIMRVHTRFHYHLVAQVTIGDKVDLMRLGIVRPQPIADISHIVAIEEAIADGFHVAARDQTGHQLIGADARIQKRVVVVNWQLLRAE